ncbi:MAG: lipopolysaccharide heptosyltransferase II [Acidobacteriota bacterium]|nr:MAG: lipopolysaccharide heptosyltransferase II [Acidobacteriota bacterium]
MKILVRGTNWIGDSVMSVPAMKLLRATFPDASITLATKSWAEGIFRDADFIDEILVLEAGGHSPKAIRSQAGQLRKGGFDAALIFTNSFGSALVARAAGIPKRYGYAGEGRGILLTKAFPKPDWRSEKHEVFYYLELARSAAEELGGKPAGSDPDVSIAVSETRREEARRMLASKGIDSSAPLIAFGAGSQNSLAKRWMPEKFAAVADALSEELGSQAVLLGSKEDQASSAEVSNAMKSQAFDLTGETALAEAVAVVAESDIMISNDMGLAHVASAVGTPAVTVFGPTNHLTTAPWGGTVVREPVECSPCMLRECPIDHRCMTRVTPEMVIESALAEIRKK